MKFLVRDKYCVGAEQNPQKAGILIFPEVSRTEAQSATLHQNFI